MLRPPGHQHSSLYFVSGWIDAAAIGGVSIVVFVFLRLLSDDKAVAVAIQCAAVLAIFFNYPHFSATLYRLYQSPDNIRQFPVTAFGVPLLLIGAVAASLWQPERIAPYFVTLLLIWSPFHYSGQTIGITMLYARRRGFELGRWPRLALSVFVYSTFIVSLVYPNNTEPVIRYGVAIPVIHFPAWFGVGMIAILCCAAILFLGYAITWCRAQRCLLPPIILLPAFAQFVWFLPGRQSAMFYEFVPLFHSLQYLYIAWALQLGLRLSHPTDSVKPNGVMNETLRWVGRNYVGGMLLFIALPWLLFWVDLPMVTIAGVVIAAVNIHHFFVDGVIWKLRNVADTSPLMMSAADWKPQLQSRVAA